MRSSVRYSAFPPESASSWSWKLPWVKTRSGPKLSRQASAPLSNPSWNAETRSKYEPCADSAAVLVPTGSRSSR
jgi:hypothetical protein